MNDRDELSRRLWLLCEQMEQLVCALDIQQLVLANNRLRWLPMVTENVEHIVGDIHLTEVERMQVSHRVAFALGLPEDASLADLIAAVGPPHADLWRRTRLQLVSLRAEVDNLSDENRTLMQRGNLAASEVLNHLTGQPDVDTYDPNGGTERFSRSASTFDRSA